MQKIILPPFVYEKVEITLKIRTILMRGKSRILSLLKKHTKVPL